MKNDILILTLSLGACSGGGFGKQEISYEVTASAKEIEPYTTATQSSQLASRTLSTSAISEDGLDFLDEAYFAKFSVNAVGKLNLKLYTEENGDRVEIPESFPAP